MSTSSNAAHEWLNESNFLCDLPTGLGLVSTSSCVVYKPILKLEFIGDGTSFVWKYFGFLEDDIKLLNVYCSLCNTKFRFTKSTTCLVFHLENSHKIYSGSNAVQDDENQEQNQEQTLWANWLIYSFLVKDLLNPSIIQGEGFHHMISAMVKDFKVPETSVITSQYISDNYFLNKANLKKDLLTNVNSGLAISMDLWMGKTSAYLTVTVHFLNEDWQKQTRVLETQSLPVTYVAKDILVALKSVIQGWNLKKQSLVVVSELNDVFLEVVEELELEHLGCFGHTLNEVVCKAIVSVPEVSMLISKARQIVKTICSHVGKTHLSTTLRNNLCKALSIESLDEESKDVDEKDEDDDNQKSTNPLWCSTLKMLKFFSQHQGEVGSFLHRSDSQELLFTLQDISILKQLIDILGFFETATEVLSSDSYPCLGLVYPAVKTLTAPKNNLILASIKSLVNCFQKLLRKKLMSDRNWNRLYTASAALDPRFKSLLNDETIWEVLNREYQEKILESEDHEAGSSDQSTEVTSPASEDTTKSSKFMMLFSGILEKQKISPIMTQIRALEDEVRVFHHYPVTPEEAASLNVFDWWREKAVQFPLLSSLAKKILMIPATCVPSQVLFSTENSQINKRRVSLKEKMIDKMLFLHHNTCK